MRKIDKLVLHAFIGPFFLTFLVVVFILLNIQMLRYFDDIIGKGLEWINIAELLWYFAIFTTPTAFPLAILLSSLIAFGNLGEHFELTAIKSAGISLVRALLPIFVFVVGLTAVAFYTNNYLVPKAALQAYSLLYDIKQKKPALDLREGTFYNGIPDISIKVDRKYSDDEAALGGIVLYDHSSNDGNKEVTKADSGRMYTILGDRYIKFELFNGFNYTEGAANARAVTGKKSVKATESFTRTRFDRTQVVYDLSSFDIKRTDQKWFQSNRMMRNMSELDYDIDSIESEIANQQINYFTYRSNFFMFLGKRDSVSLPPNLAAYKTWRDSVEALPSLSDSLPPSARPKKANFFSKNHRRSGGRIAKVERLNALREKRKLATLKTYKPDTTLTDKVDSVFNLAADASLIQAANNMARQAKMHIQNSNTSLDTYIKELRIFETQWHKILASSFACIAMFLIGAPLGAIIKKGGLGVPFLVSILFFIIYYVLTMQGEKLVKQDIVSAFSGVWAADFVLFFVGLLFLRQARVDARLFEADFYAVTYLKIKTWFAARRTLKGAKA